MDGPEEENSDKHRKMPAHQNIASGGDVKFVLPRSSKSGEFFKFVSPRSSQKMETYIPFEEFVEPLSGPQVRKKALDPLCMFHKMRKQLS